MTYIIGCVTTYTVTNPRKDDVYSLAVNTRLSGTEHVSSGLTHDWICIYEHDAREQPFNLYRNSIVMLERSILVGEITYSHTTSC